MDSTPEETPKPTARLDELSREELMDIAVDERQRASALAARAEMAEARLELATGDLRRQLKRVVEYREFGRQWRELLTSEVRRLGEELYRVKLEAESALAMLDLLTGEPDGQEHPSFVELITTRKDWIASAGGRVPFAEESFGFRSGRNIEDALPNFVDMDVPSKRPDASNYVPWSERFPPGMVPGSAGEAKAAKEREANHPDVDG
jgi:hypothetical protein